MIRPHLHVHLGDYLPHHLTRAVKRLFESVGILGLAISAVTIFEPIYLFTLGYPLRVIVAFYLVVYLAYVLLLPVGTVAAARLGYGRAMLIGALLYVPYYLALFEIASYPILLGIAPLLFALQKTFYWPAYHADFARYSTKGEIGREIGEASLVITIMSILGPVLGGLIIAVSGFSSLFVVVIVLIVLSTLPLFSSTRRPIRERVSLGDPYRALFHKENRSRVTAYLGYGEEVVTMVLWPVFIFTVTSAAIRVGAIMTIAGIVVSLALLILGRMTDRRRPQPMVQNAAMTVGVVSVLRVLATTAPLVLLGESVYRIARATVDLPVLRDVYEHAKRAGVLVTVSMFELGLVLGKIILLFALFGILTLQPEPWLTIFLLSGVMSLLYARFPRDTASLALRR
ncbi:MAG: MFS transporter [Candidatus Kerfeldbacteria bacterium]|nr:MFS transporter [Candidatus Kerfeldbacteria bacterium]